MGVMGVKWFGAEFIKKLETAIEIRLDICAVQVMNTAIDLMKTTPLTASKGRAIRRRKKIGTKVSYVDDGSVTQGGGFYAKVGGQAGIKGFKILYRSLPGNPPAVQTGHLKRSITWERAGRYTRRVGTNLPYGLYLELGTKKMLARPFLRPAMEKSKDFIEKQLKDVM